MEPKPNQKEQFSLSASGHQAKYRLTSRYQNSQEQATEKSHSPKVYTFYQSTRNQDASNTSNGLEKRNSDTGYQPLIEGRRRIVSEMNTNMQRYSGKLKESSSFHENKGQSSFRKSETIPQISCFNNEVGRDRTVSGKLSSSVHNSNSWSTAEQGRKIVSPQMIESTIIESKAQDNEKTSSFTLSSQEIERKIQQENLKQMKNLEEEHFSLKQRFSIIEAENKMLEERNLALVREMLQSESTMREFEEKQNKMIQASKKNEDSLKISRNIITSLNDRIARLQKQSEVSAKTYQESCQKRLATLQIKNSEALKASQSQVFELKLKIIDQESMLDEAVRQAQKKIRAQMLKESSKQVQEALINPEKVIKQRDAKISEMDKVMVRMHKDLDTMSADFQRLHQEKMKEAQNFNRRILNSQEKRSSSEATVELYRKQKQLQAQELDYLRGQLARRQGLISSKESQNQSQVTQLKEQLYATKAEVSEMCLTIQKCIKQRDDANNQLNNLRQELMENQDVFLRLQSKCSGYTEEQEVLEDKIEQKDGTIADLNVKNISSQLQILDLKERLRKITEVEQDSIQEDIDVHVECKEALHALQTQLKSTQQQITKNTEAECLTKQYEIELSKLRTSLLSRQNEIIQLQFKLSTLTQTSSKTKNESEIKNENLTQELFNSKMELQEKLKLKEVEMSLLQSQLECIKEQNVGLEKQLKEMESQKFIGRTKENEKIEELEQKVQECQKKQKLALQQLQEMRVVLRKQQQDYYKHLEQQLQKFTKIEFQQNSPVEPQIETQQQHIAHDSNAVPSEYKSEDHMQQSQDQTLQQWLQKVEQHTRQDLISKVQELYFVNKSLQMKVSDINDMEDNTNDMIMNKIKLFEDIIEKYEQEIAELQEQNQLLHNQVREINEKNEFVSGRLEWMDTAYKELEINLMETNEEMLKSQAVIVNLKMKSLNVTSEEDYFETISDKKIEEHQQFDIVINCPQEENKVEKIDIVDSPCSMRGQAQIGTIDNKQKALSQLKLFSQQLSELTEDIAETHQKQVQLQNHDEQPQQQMTAQQQEDLRMQKFMQGQYDIKTSQVEGVSYSIVVSHVDSQEEQYEVCVEEERQKEEKRGVEGREELEKEEMDRILEEYQGNAKKEEEGCIIKKTDSIPLKMKGKQERQKERKDRQAFQKALR